MPRHSVLLHRRYHHLAEATTTLESTLFRSAPSLLPAMLMPYSCYTLAILCRRAGVVPGHRNGISLLYPSSSQSPSDSEIPIQSVPSPSTCPRTAFRVYSSVSYASRANPPRFWLATFPPELAERVSPGEKSSRVYSCINYTGVFLRRVDWPSPPPSSHHPPAADRAFSLPVSFHP